MKTRYQSGMISRKWIIVLAIPSVLILTFFGCRSAMRYEYEQARTAWMVATLPQLAQMSATNEQILTEINQIKHPTPDLNFTWANDHVLLMTNGDFLIYAFYHGFNNGFIDHLFLAHGSDGRWYYNTYHFCSHMSGVIGDEPPGSIADFTRRYAVREFDGRSEVCLQHTWP